MNILYYKIALFSLIPIGLLLLIIGIKLLWKASKGKVLLTLPFNDNTGQFSASKSGVHSICQTGPILRKTPAGNFRPQIINVTTNEVVRINTSIMSPRSNNFSTGTMELFTFYAPAGEYRLELVEGSSVSSFQKILGTIIPLAEIDLSQYYVEIRESQSQVLTMLSIPLLLLGMTGMVCGLVFGLLIE